MSECNTLASGRWLRATFVASGALAQVFFLPTPVTGRPLAPEDLYQLQAVDEPQISPDGRWVAYSVTREMQATDEEQSDVWLVSWDGRQTVQVTDTPDTSEHQPRFSPDGRYLAFLADRDNEDGDDQVWIIDRRGSEARQLTRFAGSVAAYDWSPDGSRLVFAAEPGRDREPGEDGDKDTERPVPIVIDRYYFKQDERGYLGSERSHLYLTAVPDGATTQLTDGPYDEILPAWSPDGRVIGFFSKHGADPDTHDNWDVWLVEPRAGAAPRQLTTYPGTDGDPTEEWGAAGLSFTPDTRAVAYLRGGPPELFWYGISQVAVTAAAGGPARLPTDSLDRNTVDPQWSADGRWLYFRIEDDGSVQLARQRRSGGAIERLTPRDMTIAGYRAGPGGHVVVLATTLDRPPELAALDGARLRWLTHHNDGWLAGVELVTARNIEFPGTEGASIHALLATPKSPRPASGYPTILRLHGGPVSQFQHEFEFEWQYLIGKGYAVLGPNPRGSTGRGAKFQQRLIADWGYVDVGDVLAAVDHVVATGVADPARLGVGGWSYGAILTNYVVASDTRFGAAISGAGMSNMLAGYGTDQYVREWELELGLPWENTGRWLRLSYPFLHANRIRTPTLFMGGSEDWNVPVMHSEQMYEALRRLGVATELVVYPGESHAITRPSFEVDRLRRDGDWYDRFLEASAAAATPGEPAPVRPRPRPQSAAPAAASLVTLHNPSVRGH